MKEFLILLVVIVLGFLVYRAVTYQSDSDKFRENCESQVKARLRSPITAQFEYQMVFNRGKEESALLGQVHSQNGFGAMIATYFACEGKTTSTFPTVFLGASDVDAFVAGALDMESGWRLSTP